MPPAVALAGNSDLTTIRPANRVQRPSARRKGSPLLSELEALSDRELEVFRMLGEGRKIDAIAAQLRLRPKTVGTFRDRIRQKLGLRDSRELLRYALQWVLGDG